MMRKTRMKEDFLEFPLNMDPERPFRLQMAGVSYCDGTYRITRKNSPTFVFEYVMSGRGTLVVNGHRFEPGKGDLYMVPSFTFHEYYSSKEDPWIKIWFNTSGPLVTKLIESYRLEGICLVPDCDVRNIFEDAFKAIRKNPAKAEKIAELAVHRIIIEAAEKHGASRLPYIPEEALKLKKLLDSKSDLSIGQMAGHIKRSQSQTMRIFRKYYGTTPYNYLLMKKIENAKILLAETGLTVKEIAFKSGFSDEYYFSNIFKSKAGCSPSLFRRKPHR